MAPVRVPRPARLCALLFAALAGELEPVAAPVEAQAPRVEQDAPQEPPPLVAGELPADTAPAARELWERFVAAQQVSERAGPVRSFAVRFALRTRRGVQTNDLEASLAWRAPGAVRFEPKAKPAVGRSAAGRYWMRDGDEVVWYDGRDYEVDREQIDEALDLAHTFARLSDPTRLRIAALRVLERAPRLPKADGIDPRKLTWIEVHSPDFALPERGPVAKRDGKQAGPRLERVELGLDAETLTPRVARVTPLAPPQPPPPAAADGPPPPMPVVERVFVLNDVREVGRRRVPHAVLVYQKVLGASDPVGAGERPSQELFLQQPGSRFDVELPDSRFEP